MENSNKENIILLKNAFKMGITGGVLFIILNVIWDVLKRYGIDVIQIIMNALGLQSEMLGVLGLSLVILYGFTFGVFIVILIPADKRNIDFVFAKSSLAALVMSAIVMLALYIYPIYNAIWGVSYKIPPRPSEGGPYTIMGLLLFVMMAIIYFIINVPSVVTGSIVTLRALRSYKRHMR